jgi:hypothetical protein
VVYEVTVSRCARRRGTAERGPRWPLHLYGRSDVADAHIMPCRPGRRGKGEGEGEGGGEALSTDAHHAVALPVVMACGWSSRKRGARRSECHDAGAMEGQSRVLQAADAHQALEADWSVSKYVAVGDTVIAGGR